VTLLAPFPTNARGVLEARWVFCISGALRALDRARDGRLTSASLEKAVGSALETENWHEHKERRTIMRKAQIYRAVRLLAVLVIVEVW
jgi:hypothetical protein